MTDSSPSPEVEEKRLPPNVVPLKGASPYVGARAQAARARTRLHEIVRAGDVAKADLDGVAVMTPAFADVCFGELFTALGEDPFRKSVRIINGNESCVLLIEAVLERRAGPGSEAPEDDDAGPEVAEEVESSDDAESAEAEAEADAEPTEAAASEAEREFEQAVTEPSSAAGAGGDAADLDADAEE